jgi:hypothetical protein
MNLCVIVSTYANNVLPNAQPVPRMNESTERERAKGTPIHSLAKRREFSIVRTNGESRASRTCHPDVRIDVISLSVIIICSD